MKLLRLDYLLHRWLGIGLGALVFIWFASGVVLMYYPYPSISESRELGALRPFEPDSGVIGFAKAWSVAEHSMEEGHDSRELVSARFKRLGDGAVYQFLLGSGVPMRLVDAHSGGVIPVTAGVAEAAARELVRGGAGVARAELLTRADHYMMDVAYAPQFPAWRVRFEDPKATAVYVNARGGNPFGVVTRLTRLTTWIGPVPHWFYFIWLYDRAGLWSAAFVVAASGILFLALTGIVWGLSHLLRSKTYRGVSKWHHLSGLVFGVLVLSWTASGLYQNFGAGSYPGAGAGLAIRGGPTRWTDITVPEREALEGLRHADSTLPAPGAIDLLELDGRPGYVFHFSGGRSAWVDATTGLARGELDQSGIRREAERAEAALGPPVAIERLTAADDYYYARHGREVHLPVWRVSFPDPEGSRLYLDPVSGAPLALVGRAARRARWLRDAMHSLDFHTLNNRRPLWDLVILPLLGCGLLVSSTGVWLAWRRLRRG